MYNAKRPLFCYGHSIGSPSGRSSNSPSSMQAEQGNFSHAIVLELLDTILDDFGLSRSNGKSSIELRGSIPVVSETKSERINMSLIGAIPSLGNAIVATQIFEARKGESQTIEVDLQRAHNYLDPDIGMTPSINGQVRVAEIHRACRS